MNEAENNVMANHKDEHIDVFYEEFVDNLNQGENCVLILGPLLAVNDKGVGYKEYFKKLMKSGESKGGLYFPEENLFYFNNDPSYRNIIKHKIKQFYKSVGDKGLLDLIAHVRFPLIINVCPDEALYKTLKHKLVKKVTLDHFAINKHNKPQELSYPEKNNPIIYNIFGRVSKDLSLVLTYKNLFETIEKLIPSGSMPIQIENYIKDSNTFLFLGFSFDSWPYQLVCHKLGISDKTTLISRPTEGNNSLFTHVREKHFKMTATRDNPTEAIERIIKLCRKNDYTEVLRDNLNIDHLALFVSYGWGDDIQNTADRATIINSIKAYFKQNDLKVQVQIDRDVMTAGDSIDSFMNRIGQGKFVIRVISDKYLKSEYCMTEAIRIAEYRGNKSEEKRRVVNILWEDINQDLVYYKKFWRDRLDAELKKIDEQEFSSKTRITMTSNHRKYVDIFDFIDEFYESIKDNVGLALEQKNFKKDANGKFRLKKAKKRDFDKFMGDIVNVMRQSI